MANLDDSSFSCDLARGHIDFCKEHEAPYAAAAKPPGMEGKQQHWPFVPLTSRTVPCSDAKWAPTHAPFPSFSRTLWQDLLAAVANKPRKVVIAGRAFVKCLSVGKQRGPGAFNCTVILLFKWWNLPRTAAFCNLTSSLIVLLICGYYIIWLHSDSCAPTKILNWGSLAINTAACFWKRPLWNVMTTTVFRKPIPSIKSGLMFYSFSGQEWLGLIVKLVIASLHFF